MNLYLSLIFHLNYSDCIWFPDTHFVFCFYNTFSWLIWFQPSAENPLHVLSPLVSVDSTNHINGQSSSTSPFRAGLPVSSPFALHRNASNITEKPTCSITMLGVANQLLPVKKEIPRRPQGTQLPARHPQQHLEFLALPAAPKMGGCSAVKWLLLPLVKQPLPERFDPLHTRAPGKVSFFPWSNNSTIINHNKQ